MYINFKIKKEQTNQNNERRKCEKTLREENAHAGNRTRVTSMGGLYDTPTLRALLMMFSKLGFWRGRFVFN